MKTGIELIAKERFEQKVKHGKTIEADVKYNHGQYEQNGEQLNNPQLAYGARLLIEPDNSDVRELFREYPLFSPNGWDKDRWYKMMDKPYVERLIIAGALIAAEIDRLQSIQKKQS